MTPKGRKHMKLLLKLLHPSKAGRILGFSFLNKYAIDNLDKKKIKKIKKNKKNKLSTKQTKISKSTMKKAPNKSNHLFLDVF